MMAALLSRVSGENGVSQKNFAQAKADFQSALDALQQKQMSEEEKPLIKQLHSAYPVFIAEAEKFLDPSSKSKLSGNNSFTQLSADTLRILDLMDKLILAHGNGLNDDNEKSTADVNNTIRVLLLTMIIAIIVAIYTSFRLGRGLIEPLAALTKSVKQIGEGNLDQSIPVSSYDEVGALATSFNQMALQLKKYRDSASGELIRLHRTIRSTLASFPDPIFVLNEQGLVELRNPEADKLAVKLLFSGVKRLPEKVDEKVEEVRSSGNDYLPTHFKDALRLQVDDRDHYYLPRIVTLRDEQEQSFGVAVILEEVTRMHLLDEIKSNLVSTVSHELKTPLTSVRMALYLLLENILGPMNPKQTELVTTARDDADRLLKTLNDLLDLAKLEQGTPELETTQVQPEELVATALRNVKEIAAAAEVILSANIVPGLPSVAVDQQRIGFVFNNLLTNAIKYSPPGGSVEVRAQRDEDEKEMVRFSVEDQGPGINAEQCSRIFDRFYRVPGTQKTGAGLGLFIAREVVNAHGGKIGVTSVMGKGSEFYFLLPIQEVTNDKPFKSIS